VFSLSIGREEKRKGKKRSDETAYGSSIFPENQNRMGM